MATLTRKEKEFIEVAKGEGIHYAGYLVPYDDIMTRRVATVGVQKDTARPDSFHVGDFQITYSFSSAIRKNKFPLRWAKRTLLGKKGQYGASGFSFRLLYDFLCREYNGGEYFIDTYFARVFSSRAIFKKFIRLNGRIQESIASEREALLEKVPLKMDGTPNMWYKVSKFFMNFKAWQDPIIKSECKDIAREIRLDIIRSLSTGKIPLRKQAVSPSTEKTREHFAGLDARQYFYASGQLIEHLSVYVELGV